MLLAAEPVLLLHTLCAALVGFQHPWEPNAASAHRVEAAHLFSFPPHPRYIPLPSWEVDELCHLLVKQSRS